MYRMGPTLNLRSLISCIYLAVSLASLIPAVLSERLVLPCEVPAERLDPGLPRSLDHAPVRSAAIPHRPQVDFSRAVEDSGGNPLGDAVLRRLRVSAAERAEPDTEALNREVQLVEVEV